MGLGEWEVGYGAKGVRHTLLARGSLSLDVWKGGKEVVLTVGKRIVKQAG